MNIWECTPNNKQATHSGVDFDWSARRLNQLLTEIDNMPRHNICKPGSPFYVTLLQIGSLVKGSQLRYDEVLSKIIRTCDGWIIESEVSYQFKRAYQRAKPLARNR